MADVAREAGVSLMTVSRVVNDKGEVSPATRQCVLDVIELYCNRRKRSARIASCCAVQGSTTANCVRSWPGTPLFCYNDLAAVGALQACADLGRQVPGDLAVVGYDDIPLSALVTPPSTTCRVPRYGLGVQAMRLLLDPIDGCSEECMEIVLQPELVVRTST